MMNKIFEWWRCEKIGILFLGAIFMLVVLFSSCTKLKGTYQVAIKNATPFRLNKVTVRCGAEPITFDVNANSLSGEKTLELGGREIVGPIFLSVGVITYFNDSTVVENIGVSDFDRQILKSAKLNYFSVQVDSTKLPEVKFKYALEE
jgi:hypothetical protein